tara:strand:- start:129 stop:800 length:672 start_codon:yes stop_codon:yes gene_type:complete
MNKISLYILLILVFLGLSKSFSPNHKNIKFLKDNNSFSILEKEAPVSLILIENFTRGTFIKSYLQKYKLIHGFKPKENKVIIFRTTKDFWLKSKENLGMSLFRRDNKLSSGSDVPMPPGTLFIGDLAYGNWQKTQKGDKVWVFRRSYSHFPDLLGWGNFKPNEKFYLKALENKQKMKAFYGENNEFKKTASSSDSLKGKEPIKKKIISYLKSYWSFPKMKEKK